mmetsp:Transcript_19119/g.36580  ORF Transcript_19119/g.36580 Transcript_19119/m.36580 type:complete len:282 (+) Transcript_19119:637-1482(+)
MWLLLLRLLLRLLLLLNLLILLAPASVVAVIHLRLQHLGWRLTRATATAVSTSGTRRVGSGPSHCRPPSPPALASCWRAGHDTLTPVDVHRLQLLLNELELPRLVVHLLQMLQLRPHQERGALHRGGHPHHTHTAICAIHVHHGNTCLRLEAINIGPVATHKISQLVCGYRYLDRHNLEHAARSTHVRSVLAHNAHHALLSINNHSLHACLLRNLTDVGSLRAYNQTHETLVHGELHSQTSVNLLLNTSEVGQQTLFGRSSAHVHQLLVACCIKKQHGSLK